MNDFAAGAVLECGEDADARPGVCRLDLWVDDTLIVSELLAHAAGADRDGYAMTALRIGVLALKQAQGRLDADVIRSESDRLLAMLEERLTHHQRSVHDHVAVTLREYFDPKSGRFNERVEALVSNGGELERLLRSQIGTSDSELARTLAAHVGEQSALMKILRPGETEGILHALSAAMKSALESQRAAILSEFSLDNGGSALTRLVKELSDRHGQFASGLKDSVNEVIGEFSLDKPDSALSRLVGQVESAQRKISSEFSLDEQSSALARMKAALEQLIEKHNRDNDEFRADVRQSLAALHARKEESQRSTRHGLEFEQAVCDFVGASARAAGDIFEHVGASTGLIRNCKTGDAVLTLGPEHAAAGARIVVEAKQHASYDLAAALSEIEQARKNRQASVGLFVFSRRTLTVELSPLARFGSDIIVVWDCEDAASDVVLTAALSLARALCARSDAVEAPIDVDVERLHRAMLDVEKQIQGMDEIRKCAQSIRSSADRIEDRARLVSENIVRATKVLNEETRAIAEFASIACGRPAR
jgi:hypothetical protein